MGKWILPSDIETLKLELTRALIALDVLSNDTWTQLSSTSSEIINDFLTRFKPKEDE